MELFHLDEKVPTRTSVPLARRMVPRTVAEVMGQQHILGSGTLLTRLIEADRITSLILYGPPGSGKTSLGTAIANTTRSHYEKLNATTAGISDLRRLIQSAKNRLANKGVRTLIFLDEIHRLNRLQQDVLLPDVEDGTIVLIGATLHNPFFAVNSALISRSHVFELRPLTPEDLRLIFTRALQDRERGLGLLRIEMAPEAMEHLISQADGDARRLLNALEVGALSTAPDADGVIRFGLRVAEETVQKKAIRYDSAEGEHYDTISAFIKSMRGSDPDATLYYLAKMLVAGEDPRFIARRIVICAAEDVGNADPQALILANAAFQVAEFVGLPEARLPLAQAAVYLACAPKSNATLAGLEAATRDVEENTLREVPEHLRAGNYPGATRLKHGAGYRYPHDAETGFVRQQYLVGQEPDQVVGKYYRPTERGFEKAIKDRLVRMREPGSTGRLPREEEDHRAVAEPEKDQGLDSTLGVL